MAIDRIEAAQIITCDPLRPAARSMTFKGATIAGLDQCGDGHSTDASTGNVLRMPGCWVVPGLIDSHLHLLMGGLSLGRLDLSGVRSRGEFEALVSQRSAQLNHDQWTEAFGWSEHVWGGERPTHAWLAGAGSRPAVAWRCDQHVALVNQAAMSLLDLSRDPPGGKVERDSMGNPTGLLIEQAAWQLLGPRIPQPTAETKLQACRAACRHLNSLGITTAGAMEYLCDVESILAPARDSGSLTVRLRTTLLDREDPLPFGRARAIDASEFLEVIGFKSFADGTLGSSTAAMLEPYLDGTGSGSLLERALAGDLEQWMRAVLEAGYSPSIHAIGDRALACVIAAALLTDPEMRCRVEHAQLVSDATMPLLKGRTLSMQPYHKATDAPLARTRLGRSRCAGMFAFRDLLATGARLAFGSDWPIVTADPIAGMRCAITGIAEDSNAYETRQNLTPAEALAAYTTCAARCLGLEGKAGRLAPGHFADAVVLDRNPLECDWAWAPPRVIMTIAAGEVRHDARTAHAIHA